MSESPVEYSVELEDRHAHLYRVEAHFPVGGAAIDLQLPIWTPGSYLIREYPRHVQELAADDGHGRSLPVEKVDKATWRVDAREAKSVRVRYRVYGWDLTVRSAHLDDTHGFWNGACLFLYHAPLAARPARVRVRAPEGWRVTTALDAAPDGAFHAANYDELVDSPFEVGPHELVHFTAQDRPHRLAIWGKVERDRAELTRDLTKIIDAQAALFGGVPYPHYTFILLAAPNAYGGLEHARSSTLLTSPHSFATRKKYEEFLELASHELFHLWNVKRIHPSVLGPFDYQREAYTRALWMMEGVTSYYDRLMLVRAGLQQPKTYLEKLGEELQRIAATPGRLRASLEEASFDAWIKHYRPDENTVNSTISYYLKGGVVALLLDLEIRARSRGERTLDDAMRLFWTRYGARGEGFAEEVVQRTVEEATGVELGGFFDKLVRGRDELDAAPFLRAVGLRVKTSLADEPAEGEPAGGWLGATLKEDAALTVSGALDGGPAVAAGLYAGDEIVALDGFRVDLSGLKERLASRKPGDKAAFTIFRRDELRSVTVTLGERPHDKFQVVPVEDPSDAERAAYRAWLGADLPAADDE